MYNQVVHNKGDNSVLEYNQDRDCTYIDCNIEVSTDVHCCSGKAIDITGQLKCDGTRAQTRFRLSAKRTCPFKSAGGRQFSRLLAAEVCASAVVMLDTPCSEVV